ncbi:MAG TPA: hypothetical protein EYH56_02330 [Nanoarchaeota archaeon]|nr:hypothetical protein [Nanoarchaeota archaeon]
MLTQLNLLNFVIHIVGMEATNIQEKVFSKLEKARALVEELDIEAGNLLENNYISFEEKLKYLKELKKKYETKYLRIRYELEFQKEVLLKITVELSIDNKLYKYTKTFKILENFEEA